MQYCALSARKITERETKRTPASDLRDNGGAKKQTAFFFYLPPQFFPSTRTQGNKQKHTHTRPTCLILREHRGQRAQRADARHDIARPVDRALLQRARVLGLRAVRRAVPPQVPQPAGQVEGEGEGDRALGRQGQQRVRPGPGVDRGGEVPRQREPPGARRAHRQGDAGAPVEHRAERVDGHLVVEGLAVDLEDVRGDGALGRELKKWVECVCV